MTGWRRKLLCVIIICQTLGTGSAFSAPARGGEDGWLREAPFGYSIRSSSAPSISPKLRSSAAGDRGAPDSRSSIYEFEWRKSDWNGKRSGKGTELKTRPMPWMKEQWARLSFFADAKYFSGDTRFAIIMQYHSVPDVDLGEQWRNPVSSLVIRGNNLQYDYRSSVERVTPKDENGFNYTGKGTIQLGQVRFNEWNEIIFHQTFDTRSGNIKIWLNGQVFERNNVGIGYNDKHGMFLKFGLYCPANSDLDVKRISFRDVEILPATPNDPVPSEEEALRLLRME